MRKPTTRISFLCAVLTALFIAGTSATAGELEAKIGLIYQTCVGQELVLEAQLTNLNADFDIGNTKTWVDIMQSGSLVYSSENSPDEREIKKSQESVFDYSTGWIPTAEGNYLVILKAEGEFAINGRQESSMFTNICPSAPCPERPSVSSTEIYLGSGNSGSTTYSAQANCCYKIKLTIVTGRNAVTSSSPQDWVEFTGGSQEVSITVDRAEWGESYIVARVDYQDCEGENRGSDYILVRDGVEQTASDPTPQPPGVTTGQTPQAGMDGDPTNTALGERVGALPVASIDAELLAKVPVTNVRQYLSSLPNAVNTDNGYGPGWANSFNIRGVVTDHEAYVIMMDGKTIRFRKPQNDYILDWPTDRAYSFAKTSEGAVFSDPVEHRVYEFDASGYLDAIHDGYGFTVDVTYENGLLSSVSLPSGKGLSYTHREDGRITSVTDGQATTTYGYNDAGILTSFTNADGNTTTYTYQRDWLLSSVTTPEGRNAFTAEFDDNNKVIRQNFGESSVVTYAYNSGSTTISTPLGVALIHEHDSMHRLTSSTDADGNTARFGYDDDGNRTTITDRNDATTERTYTNGLLTQVKNPDGGTWQWEYSPRTFKGVTLFELDAHTLPNGAVFTYQRDSDGRPTRITHPSGAELTYSYNGLGNATAIKRGSFDMSISYDVDGLAGSITDHYGTTTTIDRHYWGGIASLKRNGETIASQDFALGRDLTSISTISRGTVAYTRDADARVASATDGEGQSWSRFYDTRGRLIRAENPNGGGMDLTWNGFVNLGIGFGNGQDYQVLPDLNGRVVRVTNPTGAAWTTDYTKEGALMSVVLPGDATWTFGADNMGRPTSMLDPEGRSWSVVHDNMGRRTSTTLPSGSTLTYEYSQDLTTKTTRFGDLSLRTHYDLGSDSHSSRVLDDLIWNMSVDASERKVNITSPSGATRSTAYNEDGYPTSFDYGSGHRILYSFSDHLPVKAEYKDESHTWSFNNSKKLNSADGKSITRDATGRITGYDNVTYELLPVGRVKKISLDADRWIQYSYDSRGYVNEVEDWIGGKTSVVFDALGHLCDITYPNGFHVAYSWSPGGVIAGATYGDSWSIDYSYNDAGQLTGVERNVGIEPDYRSEDHTMTYDQDNHLEQGTYDALDNLTGTSTTPKVTYGGFGPTQIDWSAQTARITTDLWGDPTEYNVGDYRVSMRWNLGAHYRLPLEITENDKPTTIVSLPMGVVLYGIDGEGARHHYLDDGKGNVVLETDEDNNIIGGRLYSPFGATIGKIGMPGYLGYRGTFGGITFQDPDSDNDVVMMDGRVYFPTYGRFGSSAGLFSGLPQSDDPRYANPSVPAMDPIRYLGSGQNIVDLVDRYQSACDIDEEDFVLPKVRYSLGWDHGFTADPKPSGGSRALGDEFKIGSRFSYSGGLSAGFLSGYSYLEEDNDQLPEKKEAPPVRYVSPTLAGFTLSAEYEEDDMWNAALRYAGEFGSFRVRPKVDLKTPPRTVAELFLQIMEDGPPPSPPSDDEPTADSNNETPNSK